MGLQACMACGPRHHGSSVRSAEYEWISTGEASSASSQFKPVPSHADEHLLFRGVSDFLGKAKAVRRVLPVINASVHGSKLLFVVPAPRFSTHCEHAIPLRLLPLER